MKKINTFILVLVVFGIILSGCKQSTSTMEESPSTVENSSIEASSSFIEEVTEMTSSESNISTTETEDIKQEVSINDFVGVWGIPNSDNFFVINNDSTYTDPTVKDMPLDNLEFGVDEVNRPFMNIGEGEEKSTSLLENNGTLTSNRINYLYFGNYTYDEFVQLENPGEGITYTEPFITSPEEAVESAKVFMSFENKDDLENYMFTPSELETDSRPNYSVNVRQKGNEEVNSMAIGRIIVYTDNGQCHWGD